jgi:hypothetical protein
MGEVGGRKWERRRNGRKNKKFSVLECRIILWVFFSLYMMWQIVIGGCKKGLLHPIRREVILKSNMP